jgi:hypothetical protein
MRKKIINTIQKADIKSEEKVVSIMGKKIWKKPVLISGTNIDYLHAQYTPPSDVS